MGNPFLKKNQIEKLNQKIDVKMPHVNKTNSDKIKFGSNKKTTPSKNDEEIGKPFRKKLSEKTVKIKVKLPHVNKKPLARKRIFVQTPFSHSTLKIE